MFVSPRFRDIFSSGPVKTRRSDASSEPQRADEASAEADRDAEVESIWLDITAAHRRAARVFTPTSLRAEDLAK